MNYDVIVIGGSFAGLSAALYLARARLSVCVIDAGKPRNRFADESHGFFSQDGSNPQDMISTARAQVSAYPGVTFIEGVAVDAWKEGSGLSVALENGSVLTSSRLLLAFGISDILPEIAGLKERWGKSIIHCPYCHGYEYSDQKLGVLQVSPMSSHQAMLIANWGPTTFFLNGEASPDTAILAEIKKRNITIEPAQISALVGDGLQLSGVTLADGRLQAINALFIGPSHFLNSPIAEQIGCEVANGPFGPFIEVDDMKMTTVSDVFAAGDATRGGGHAVSFACADGVMAAMAIHRTLVFDE